MTTDEARRKGHAGGHMLRVAKSAGMECYLTDYRRGGLLTTTHPGQAEWFEYEHHANEMAERASFYTPFEFEVVSVPADASPCRCMAATFGAIWTDEPPAPGEPKFANHSGKPCPDCGSIRTARVIDTLRCFKCGNAWQPEPSYGPEDDGLTDEQVSMAARAAVDAEFPGLDDDDADLIAASLQHPGARPSVAGAVVL